MIGDHAINHLTPTEQAPAAIPLPPAGRLPRHVWPFRLDELHGAAVAAPAPPRQPFPHEAVDLRVDLGRTRLVAEALAELRPGALVPLDAAATAPVDVYVGGRLVARGEVLVLDGVFGVRVIEVIRT